MAIIGFAFVWTVFAIRPPAAAGTGLDASWRIAISDAGPAGLTFGRDVMFTFGPLGWLFFGVPSPARWLLLWAFIVGVTVCFVAAATLLLLNRLSATQRWPAAVVLITVSVYGVSIDYLVLFAALATLANPQYRRPPHCIALSALLGATAGLGFVGKTTLGIDIIAAATAFSLTEFIAGERDYRRHAAASLASAIVAFFAVSIVAFHGSLPDLSAYARAALNSAAGYSSAMYEAGSTPILVACVFEAAGIVGACAALWFERQRGLATALATVAFFAWKHGVVRQDGHVVYFLSTAALAYALILVNLQSRLARIAVFAGTAFALSAYAWLGNALLGIPPQAMLTPAQFAMRLHFITRPRETIFEQARDAAQTFGTERLPLDVAARLGDQTTDVLPWETSVVDANGLRWRPQPTLQSYAAYTPFLDSQDDAFMHVKGAARIIYGFYSIDGRYPFNDEPATFATLACRYHTDTTADGAYVTGVVLGSPFIVLARDGRSTCGRRRVAEGPGGVQFGEAVDVPQPHSPSEFVRASIVIRPTPYGAVRTFLFRSSRITLELIGRDETTRTYRLTAATASDGIIVNPAPHDTLEAGAFFASQLPGNVRAFRILADHPGEYRIESVHFTVETRRRFS